MGKMAGEVLTCGVKELGASKRIGDEYDEGMHSKK
jgi:hypothetical protein